MSHTKVTKLGLSSIIRNIVSKRTIRVKNLKIDGSQNYENHHCYNINLLVPFIHKWVREFFLNGNWFSISNDFGWSWWTLLRETRIYIRDLIMADRPRANRRDRQWLHLRVFLDVFLVKRPIGGHFILHLIASRNSYVVNASLKRINRSCSWRIQWRLFWSLQRALSNTLGNIRITILMIHLEQMPDRAEHPLKGLSIKCL